MVDVLLEKETIYSDEVNMIIGGASKEEVCEFIDNKNKTEKDNKDNNLEEKEDIKKPESEVDKLLKTAQIRSKKLEQNNIKIDDNDKTDIRKTKQLQENKEDKNEIIEVENKQNNGDEKSSKIESEQPKKSKRGRPPKNKI